MRAAPPIWTSKPTDSFVPVGGQITLPCVATGNPTVTTQWLVNGAQVPASDANQMVVGTSYMMMNAQKGENRAVQ